MGIVAGGASSLLSGIGRRGREQRQVDMQKDLMNQQQVNQRGLNQQGHDLQMDMWNKTNYKAQMGHIKDAGLNPGLMYGMSGGGGTTAGSQSGGGAQSGNAPQVQESPVSGQGAIMGMQSAAQVELMEAQARQLNAKTDKIEGVDTEGQRQTNRNLMMTESKIIAETVKLTEEYINQNTRNEIDWATRKDKIKIVELEAIGKLLQNLQTEEGTKLTKEQIDKTSQEVYQRWTEIGIKGVDTVLKGILGGGGVGAIQRLMKSFKSKK